MTRIKRGFVARNRRKKILKLTKGFRGAPSVLFRMANQRLMKSLGYAYRDRHQKKRYSRSIWISRINAIARTFQVNYSKFIYQLKQKNIILNRKLLSQLAIYDPQIFSQLFINYLKN
jgi:large subunit ribosomal protein L20